MAATPQDEVEERWLYTGVPSPARFSADHVRFTRAIAAHGVPVIRLGELVGDDPVWRLVERNPNQVYTRDSAVTLPWAPDVFIRGALRDEIRRPEAEVMATALGALGLTEVCRIPGGVFLEGGDVIPFGAGGRRVLIVGFGPRSSEDSLDILQSRVLGEDLADEVLGIELADWRINLDGALVPVSDDAVLAQPDSLCRGLLLSASGRVPVEPLQVLRDLGLSVIAVTPDEAKREACNCLCLGERRVVCYAGDDRVLGRLADHGIRATAVPGAELIKGTGGPRCMSRPIYR